MMFHMDVIIIRNGSQNSSQVNAWAGVASVSAASAARVRLIISLLLVWRSTRGQDLPLP